MIKRKNTIDVPVFDGDDGIEYIRYYDCLKILKKIKEKEDKAIEKLERILEIMKVFGLRSGKTLLSKLICESIDILQRSDKE